MSNLQSSYWEVRSKVPENVKLLCVSKNQSIDDIRELYKLGQRDFGENKVQELKEKADKLKDLSEIRWHFIGRLQTNKVKQLLAIENLFYIHSVDRMSLVEKICGFEITQSLSLFIQVNTSGEEEKGGFESSEKIERAISLIKQHDKLKVAGLMTMGKIRTDNFEKDARASFEKLRKLRDELLPDHQLSMGMSNDFEVALEYGATWVRVGSKIFRS